MFKGGKPAPDFPNHYDSHVSITIPYYLTIHNEIINLVVATGKEPVLWLDTGCGTGTLVENAITFFSNTVFVLCDPSAAMVEVASGKLKDRYPGRAIFLECQKTQNIICSGERKPDIITAVLCHHYLDKEGRREATRKCHDMLEPGGMYITVENIRPLTDAGTEIGKNNWKNFEIDAGKTAEEASSHLERFDTEYFPITVVEQLSLLHECGFKSAEIFWYSCMQAGFYGIK